MAISNRPIKLDKWGISWEEYKELSYFCLQYQRKKQEADDLLTMRISTPPPVIYHHNGEELGTFLPHGQGQTSDPVAAAANRREKLLDDVRMIERAAIMAAGSDGMAVHLLRAVTTRDGVRKTRTYAQTPIGERQFFEMRRRFFYVLRGLKNGEAPA